MSGPEITTTMRLRYLGSCKSCGTALPAGTIARYDRTQKTVECVSCVVPPIAEPVVQETPSASAEPTQQQDVGTAGASARREYERRVTMREDRVRAAHPRIGGFLLAISDEPQSTRAWNVGAIGEERLGKTLDALADHGAVHVLHDRRIPSTKANIDHIAISQAGVFVIDAKRYKGRPTLRIEGGIMRPRTETLMVGRRDCGKLVDGVKHQVDLVRAALVGQGLERVPIRGVLCFIDADWPLFGGSFSIDGISVAWPKKVFEQIYGEPEIPSGDVTSVLEHLGRAFPSA